MCVLPQISLTYPVVHAHALVRVEILASESLQLPVGRVVQRFDPDDVARCPLLMRLQMRQQLALRACRTGHQNGCGARQRFAHTLQEGAITRGLAAIDGVCLVMQVFVALAAVHDLGIHSSRAEAQHPRLLMIDPDYRVMKLIHIGIPSYERMVTCRYRIPPHNPLAVNTYFCEFMVISRAGKIVPSMPTRFLITGGAGFLGINLCRYLLARNHFVRTLDIAPFTYPERSRVDVIDGDVRLRTDVERALDGIDVVVHAAAALPLAPRTDIFSTTVDGTRLMLECASARRIQRFIYTSSTAVYGIPDHHPIVESDRLSGVGPYGESKITAEHLCEAARTGGLCVSILRPKSFVGPERLGAFELLYSWAFEGRAFPVLGNGANRYQLLDVEDLCDAIYLCATAQRLRVDDTFNVGAQDFGTMRENFQAVLDRAGHGRSVVSLPAMPARALLSILSRLHLSPLYPWIYATAAQDSFVSIDRIQACLGFAPRYSNREALIRNYDWYVAHRERMQTRTGFTHRVPWKKGALQLAKYAF